MNTATQSRHWAGDLIGRPWRAGARGPDAYDCLGLVQFVVRLRLSTELPDVAHAHESGWRPVDGPPQADDVVLCRGHDGQHIGVFVEAGGKLGVLHANGTAARGGSVMWQPLSDVAADGYHAMTVWRYTP